MVVLKHAVVFLASLATLAAASPTSAQWQRPDASATGVAHQGKPNAAAAGSNRESHNPSSAAAGGEGDNQEPGGWQHSAQGHEEEDEHKGSFQKDDGGVNKNHHQARDEDAPTKHRSFANHKGADASQHKSDGEGENDEPFKQHHARDTEDAPTKHRTFTNHKGADASGHKSDGKGENDNTFKQHHARTTEDVLEILRKIAQQEDDHDQQRRDVDHDRHGDDHGHDHGHNHDMEHESHNQMETGEHGRGKHHSTRAPTQKGVYECANQNWLHPCVWTPLKDGQCYNRHYGRLGSMGPDNGLSCTIYEQPNCNDNGWNTCGPFVWPGIKNYQNSHLLLWNGMSDNGIFSIKCKST